MAEVINIAELSFDTTKLQKSMEDYQNILFDIGKEQKRYDEQLKEINKQYSENEKEMKRLIQTGQAESKQYTELIGQQKDLLTQERGLANSKKDLQIQQSRVNSEYQKTVKEYNTILTKTGELTSYQDALNGALQRDINTRAEAKQSNIELNKIKDQLNVNIKEEADLLDLLNAKVNQNNELLKSSGSEREKQISNVGGYKDSITEAFDELDIMNGGLINFATNAQASGGATALLGNSLKSASAGVVGLTKSMLAFLATPIGIFIGILAAGFALISNAMSRSEESTNKIKVAFASLSGAAGGLMKYLKPLGSFLVDVLVGGLELVASAIEGVVEGITYLNDGIAGALEFLGFEETAKGLRETNEEVRNSAKASKELALAEIELEKAQRKARLTQLQYQKEAEVFRQIRDDESLSIAERIKANEDLGKVLDKQLQEELAIAKIALNVANLRAKAEGESKEVIDAQYAALTQIADIEERIEGQRSEQLVNRVQLQKEAHEKYMKQLDESIKKQREALDLWIAQQGDRAKTLAEQLSLETLISDKSKKILEQELKAKKISREKYNLEVLKLDQRLASIQNEMLLDVSKRELDQFIKDNQSKLQEGELLTKETLAEEIKRENAISKQRMAFELERKILGLITEQEYQDNILAIKEEALKKEGYLRNTYLSQQQAQDELQRSLELESRLLNLENDAWSEFEARQIILDEQNIIDQEKLTKQLDSNLITQENYELALSNLEKSYAKQSREIEQEKGKFKIGVAENVLGSLATIAGAEGEFQKLQASFQTANATYQGAIEAYKAMAGIPVVGPALGATAAAAVGAAGAISIKKINASKPPQLRYATGVIGVGGMVQGGGSGFSDSVTAQLSNGESVINSQSTMMFPELISAINQAGGGVGLDGANNSAIQNSLLGGTDIALIGEAVRVGAMQGSAMGSEMGSATGIENLSRNKMIQNQATF